MAPELSTLTADVICELLEVSVHQILFMRELYPREAFQLRRKFNVPVQMCLHPGVCSYIQNAVTGARILIEKRTLQCFQVAVTHPTSGVILESFVFQLVHEQNENMNFKEVEVELLKLKESFRSICVKLAVCDSLLKPLPPKCSFRFLLQLPFTDSSLLHSKQYEVTASEENHKVQWVDTNSEEIGFSSDVNIVPLKSIRNIICSLQVYIKEASSK